MTVDCDIKQRLKALACWPKEDVKLSTVAAVAASCMPQNKQHDNFPSTKDIFIYSLIMFKALKQQHCERANEQRTNERTAKTTATTTNEKQ